MRINDVLECFNKALDIKGNPNNVHYVAHSNWDKKIGAVKTATTIITLHDPGNTPKEIIREEYSTSVPAGQEDVLIEETERRALVKFIINWSNDTGVK